MKNKLRPEKSHECSWAVGLEPRSDGLKDVAVRLSQCVSFDPTSQTSVHTEFHVGRTLFWTVLDIRDELFISRLIQLEKEIRENHDVERSETNTLFWTYVT